MADLSISRNELARHIFDVIFTRGQGSLSWWSCVGPAEVQGDVTLLRDQVVQFAIDFSELIDDASEPQEREIAACLALSRMAHQSGERQMLLNRVYQLEAELEEGSVDG